MDRAGDASACWPGGHACAERPARGRALPPVRLRLEVVDDGWGPPVGDSSRAAAGWAAAGPEQRVGQRARLKGKRQAREKAVRAELGRKTTPGCGGDAGLQQEVGQKERRRERV
jgi:hypothetical protein